MAIGSGLLLSCAFPPVDFKPAAWIGLVPLWLALRKRPALGRVGLLGFLAGTAFFLVLLHPLVSAHAWTGWALETRTQFLARLTRQWVVLHLLWGILSCWGGLFWSAWAVGCGRLAPRPWSALLVAPSLWVLLVEWLFSHASFGYTSAFLGHTTADVVSVRQLAAYGGVWLLSALVVAVNIGLAEAMRYRGVGWWKLPALVAGLLAVAWGLGTWRLDHTPRSEEQVRVAVLQYDVAGASPSDFTELGIDRGMLPMLEDALHRQAHLIVLPETIAVRTVTLDGSLSRIKPPDRQVSREAWDAFVRTRLHASSIVLAAGLNTVEQGADHNSLVFWGRAGTLGWYHKRRLVPFSEYQPMGWDFSNLRGGAQFTPGQGTRLVRTGDLILGSFICQEVMSPELVRASVRDGATLLVTGGNDGVFANPAVARTHADEAQLRAVETGRFLIRATATGISAVIDPTGREVVRGALGRPALLISHVSLHTMTTPFVRFGEWVIWCAAVVVLLAALVSAIPWAERG